MRPKPIPGRPSSTDVLRKLKSQESTPLAKPFAPWVRERPNTEMFKEEKRIVVKQIEPDVINAEKILRKIEDLEKKAKHGENYLSFYGEIKMLEDQYLKATEPLNPDSKDTTISRIFLRRRAILRKRGSLK